MDERFVSDSTVIISLCNLRVVEKVATDGATHLIYCTYSDTPRKEIAYEDKELRDAMFTRLAEKLNATQQLRDETISIYPDSRDMEVDDE